MQIPAIPVRKYIQGLIMTMLLLKNHLWAVFQNMLTINVFQNTDKFDTAAVVRVFHPEQRKKQHFLHSQLYKLKSKIFRHRYQCPCSKQTEDNTVIIFIWKTIVANHRPPRTSVLITRLWNSSRQCYLMVVCNLEGILHPWFLWKLSHLVLLCSRYIPTKFDWDICNIAENRHFDTWHSVSWGKLKCEILHFKMA